MSPGYGSEWQTLREGTHRITAPESSEPEPEKMTEVPLPEGHYDPGQGDIDGAFGVSFGAPIDKSWVSKRQGWTTPPSLPADLAYRGLVQPLIENVLIAPPVEPPQLAAEEVHYSVYLDFDGLPMSISTSAFKDAEPIIEIIARKYGEPDELMASDPPISGEITGYTSIQNTSLALSWSTRMSRLTGAILRNATEPETEIQESRTRSSRAKRKRGCRLQPNSPRSVRRGRRFGLEFGRRVGFRAEPDEFVPFDAPTPLTSFDSGQYKIMVIRILCRLPCAITTGQSKKLAATKRLSWQWIWPLPAFSNRRLAIRCHSLTNTPTLCIRNGQFNFTVHDRAENSAHNDRVKEAKIAAAEAKKERKRLAELERQRQEIAARQKQIAEEKAF